MDTSENETLCYGRQMKIKINVMCGMQISGELLVTSHKILNFNLKIRDRRRQLFCQLRNIL